jgi:hypothetical protein
VIGGLLPIAPWGLTSLQSLSVKTSDGDHSVVKAGEMFINEDFEGMGEWEEQ